MSTRLKDKYGITVEAYYYLLRKQQGLCAICKQEDDYGRRLAVDHCHKTNIIRGLLCGSCNVMLGGAKDKADILKLAIEYLNKPSPLVDFIPGKIYSTYREYAIIEGVGL